MIINISFVSNSNEVVLKWNMIQLHKGMKPMT